MPMAQADRISFSLYQATAAAQIKSIQNAQANLAARITAAQSLDTGNDNLFTPVNVLVNGYQAEYNFIDGNTRTAITEQNITDAGNRVLGNFFFPNNTAVSIPVLAPMQYTWQQTMPFALSAAIGLPYSGVFPTPSASGEIPLITTILAFTGATPPSTVTAAVNTYLSTLASEKAAIQANTDTNVTNQANNAAAITNINTTVAALGSYTTLIQLQGDVTTRQTFLTGTREPQLNVVLGSITQSITDGTITASSGFYGQRYRPLNLRLNALNGSLTILASLQTANNAQTNIIANIKSTAAMYYSVLPTTIFQSNASGTQFVSLVDVSFLSVGDSVYVMADNQTELQLVVKTIVGNAVTLSDIVPPKYTVSSNVRLYKDLT